MVAILSPRSSNSLGLKRSSTTSQATNSRSAIRASVTGLKAYGPSRCLMTSGRECYDTSAEATFSGNYPIARYLYIYFNKKPNEQIDPLRGEFIKYVLSKDGQALTEKSGFYPLPSEIQAKELKRLGFTN